MSQTHSKMGDLVAKRASDRIIQRASHPQFRPVPVATMGSVQHEAAPTKIEELTRLV
jgi:hypothetical protein